MKVFQKMQRWSSGRTIALLQECEGLFAEGFEHFGRVLKNDQELPCYVGRMCFPGGGPSVS